MLYFDKEEAAVVETFEKREALRAVRLHLY